MADFMLDSTVFIDYRAGDPGARAILDQVIEGELTASVSSATVFELWGSSWFDRRAEIGFRGMLRFLEEVPITPESARIAGVWMHEARASSESGERLPIIALVAATAKSRGESVCTRDDDQFVQFYSDLISY